MIKKVFFIGLAGMIFSCTSEVDTKVAKDQPKVLLQKLPPSETGVTFINTPNETLENNYLSYEYFYNGSGVAIGDINNDGLEDIYLGGNSVADKLYLNQGNFKFIDISVNLGEEHLLGWTNGINMVDINHDGYLDIYVSRAGPGSASDRANKLFINNGDTTFTEAANEYKLALTDYSVHSAFFDYDLDGDLDLYIINHPTPDFKAEKFGTHVRQVIEGELQSDYFFENVDGTFVDRTVQSGLVGFGYRLGISVGDINNDRYPDIYISSDYDEPDVLYLNKGDGTYANITGTNLDHISNQSMGNEMSDINNDGLLDLFVLDMAPNNHFRSKAYMKSMNVQKFMAMSQYGFHNQYMRNTLHLNNGNSTFSEIAQVAGVDVTDWSWAPLFFDIDLDGNKDLFVTNGIKENFLYRDLQKDINKKQGELQRSLTLEELLDLVPSDITQNNLYRNTGDLQFEDVSDTWMTDNLINSNGAAYADLDNDGDLDLVVNNMNAISSIYENKQTKNNYLKIHLNGNDANPNALGAKVKLISGGMTQYQEVQNSRGFLSATTTDLVFGLGDQTLVDQVHVYWHDGRYSILENLDTNQQLTLSYAEAETKTPEVTKADFLLNSVPAADIGLTFTHMENNFDDFSRQVLLPQKHSTQGPFMAVADFNADGLDDVLIGGAHGQSTALYFQNSTGTFNLSSQVAFTKDANFEDQGVAVFDSDGDGDQDIFISSGSYQLEENSQLLQDRLYLNDGKGNFSRGDLPEMLSNTKAVAVVDFDKDGDMDIAVGGFVVPGKYPLNAPSYLLENNAGSFTDVTTEKAAMLTEIGLVSDIEVVDYDGDKDDDLVIVGAWMPIQLLINDGGSFTTSDTPTLEKTSGWNYSVKSGDFDGDGDMDLVVGNLGMNNKFHPSEKKPLHIFSGYFDDNQSYDMALSKIYNGELVPVRGKECSTEQTPFLAQKIGTFKEFASLNMNTIYGQENMENAIHHEVYNFKSVYLENMGDGGFEISTLPTFAQFGPTLDMEFMDINADGNLDIVGVGNIYDAEVETVRYDASQGYVLLGDGAGGFTALQTSGLQIDKDMRAVSTITVANRPHLLVASNNSGLDLYQLD